MFIMDQWPIFSGGVLLEIRLCFLNFHKWPKWPQRHLKVFANRAFPPCIKFAAVDTAVIPLKLWRPLDVCKLKDMLVLGNRVWGRDARWSLWYIFLCRICLYACWIRTVVLEPLGLFLCLELSRAGLSKTRNFHFLNSSIPFWRDAVHFHLYCLLTVLTPLRIVVLMFYTWSPDFQVNKW